MGVFPGESVLGEPSSELHGETHHMNSYGSQLVRKLNDDMNLDASARILCLAWWELEGCSVKSAVANILELSKCGFCATRVKHDAEPVSGLDFRISHGFVVVELKRNDMDQHAPPEFIFGERIKNTMYLRMDWGEDHLRMQLRDTDSDFQSHVRVFEARGNAVFVGVVALPVAAATAVSLGFGGLAAVILYGGMGAGVAYAESSYAGAYYERTVDSSNALVRLNAFLEEVKDREYSLTEWNCNHFVDGVLEVLLKGPPPSRSRYEKKFLAKYPDTPEID